MVMAMNTTELIEALDKTASELETLALDPNTKVASADFNVASDAGSALMEALASGLGLKD